MSKTTFVIPPMAAEMIGLTRAALNSAREYARGITSDPDVPNLVQLTFTHAAADCSSLISRLDARIPSRTWEAYSNQVVRSDTQGLEEIQRMWLRMSEDQRSMLELAAKGILKGEISFTEEASAYVSEHASGKGAPESKQEVYA